MNPTLQLHTLLQESLKALGLGDYHLRVTSVDQEQWENEKTSTPSIVHLQSGQEEVDLLEEMLVTHLIFNVQLRADTPDEVEMMNASMMDCFEGHPFEIDVITSRSGKSSKLKFYWREAVVRIENEHISELSLRPVDVVYGAESLVTYGADSEVVYGKD